MPAAGVMASPAAGQSQWYRIGDGYLGVCSGDERFRARLQSLFRECAVTAPAQESLPAVHCTVRLTQDGAAGIVEFDDPEPLDPLKFILTIFPDRGYRAGPPAGGRQVLLVPTPRGEGAIGIEGARMLVRSDVPWQALAGNLALNRLLRLERDVVFLHASAVSVRGRGVLLLGAKGRGKTTLALALAARGHVLLGDELTGVRAVTHELVPVRRSVSVRDGPMALAISERFNRLDAPYEPFPDGTRRRRAYTADLFPSQAADTGAIVLSDLVFLRGFAPAPRLVEVRPGREHLAALTPLASSLWERPPAEALRRLLGIINGARCWTLEAGDPDTTADLLAATLEDRWT